MNIKSLSVAALLTTVAATTSFGQDTKKADHTIAITIPEVAILDLESSGSSNAITLAATAPTEAGNALDFSTAKNTDLWINYSSIIGSTSEATRVVTAAVTSGTIPSGVDVKVTAAADAAGGAGTVGTTAGEITLSATPTNVITGVGSCYTGNGPSKGHNLTYVMSLKSGSYGSLDFDKSGTVTVTYTLSDN